MIVYITRHGQIAGRGDFPLGYDRISPLGHRQAEKLGERLLHMGFRGKVLTSPFHRCLETAEIICSVTRTHFVPEPRMGEIARDWIRDFKGYRPEEIEAHFSRCVAGAEFPWPWWPQHEESVDDVAVRVAPLIEELMQQEGDDILLVGHGATTGAALRLLGGVKAGHYNVALSAVEVPSRRVLWQNDTQHLGKGEVTQNQDVVA